MSTGDPKLREKDYIRNCIRLARQIAYRENRVAVFKKLPGFDVALRLETEELGVVMAQAAGHALVEELLPQARNNSQMRDERERFMRDSTALGRFEAVAGRFSVRGRAFDRDKKLERREEQRVWKGFCRACRTSDSHGMLQGLRDILIVIQQDMLVTDLPPQAPGIQLDLCFEPSRDDSAS